MKKIILLQFIVLLVGTIFAWTNFVIEFINWMNDKACTLGCPTNITNPFLTPCFGGAIFFAAAFSLSIVILKNTEK